MPFAQLVRHDAHQVGRLPTSVPGPGDDGLQIVGKQAFGSTARAGRSRLVGHPCGRRRKGPPVVVSQRAQGRCNVERGPLLNRQLVARRPRFARVPGRGALALLLLHPTPLSIRLAHRCAPLPVDFRLPCATEEKYGQIRQVHGHGPLPRQGLLPLPRRTLPGLSVSELAGHETFAGFKLSQAMCCSRLRPAGNSESASRRLATRWSTGRRWTVTDPHGRKRPLPPPKRSPIVTQSVKQIHHSAKTGSLQRLTKGPLRRISAAQRPFWYSWAILGSNQIRLKSLTCGNVL